MIRKLPLYNPVGKGWKGWEGWEIPIAMGFSFSPTSLGRVGKVGQIR